MSSNLTFEARLAREHERANWARLKWLFVAAIASLAILAGLLSPRSGAAQPVDSLDWRRAPNSLDVTLEVGPIQEGAATFVWTMDSGDAEVVCSLDADGDGDFDYSISDCDGQSGLRHAYDDEGVFQATIVARSRDGRSGLGSVAVRVR